MRKRSLLFISFIILLTLLSSGCRSDSAVPESSSVPAKDSAIQAPAPTSVPDSAPAGISFQSGARFSGNETDITLIINADEFSLLDLFPSLSSVDFSGSTCYEQILSFQKEHTHLSVHYTVPLGDQMVGNEDQTVSLSALSDSSPLLYLPNLRSLTVTEPMSSADALALTAVRDDLSLRYSIEAAGLIIASDTEILDLSSVSPSFCDEILDAIPALPLLKKVVLSPTEGESCWTLDQADAFQKARQDLLVDYRISVFGTSFSLADEIVSFNNIQLKHHIDDLRILLPYLRNVKRLDMESCGISNADMAKLREEFPHPKIVWRVSVGTYSCRTDAIMIRFSSNLPAKTLTDADTKVLRYCTEIRYLDLGHNHIQKMDFLSYMPDLEVVIIAVGYMNDISGIANHDKLEYCEFLSGRIKDLSPLASCPNLEHLNVSYNLISDITPLYGLKKLKRLWISRNTIPKVQIEEIRCLLPDTEINTTAQNPTGEGWRWLSERDLIKCERYELLSKQFCYGSNILTYTEETRPVYEE